MFERYKNRTASLIDIEIVKQFAVLIPYIAEEDAILFEVRAEKLNRQPNEICFPGGKIEPGEKPAEAAIRETEEELEISRENIEINFETDRLLTSYHVLVYPFFATVKNYKGSFSFDEVYETFKVPLKFFMENEPLTYNMEVTVAPYEEDFPYQLIQNGEKYKWNKSKYTCLFYQYDGRIIWGMTAKFVKNLTDILKGKL